MEPTGVRRRIDPHLRDLFDEEGNPINRRLTIGRFTYRVEVIDGDPWRWEDELLPDDEYPEATWSLSRGPTVPVFPELDYMFFDDAVPEPEPVHRGDEDASWYRRRGGLPASSTAIAALRETKAADARQAECVVCLQDFEAEDKLRMMSCSHTFHQNCIFDWLRVSCVCPLCCHALPT